MATLVCPSDLGAVGHYRTIWPARALVSQGYDVTLRPVDLSNTNDKTLTMEGEKFSDGSVVIHKVTMAEDWDTVVLQRPATQELYVAMKTLQKQGVRVVVEIDDDFQSLHVRNPAFYNYHPRTNPWHNWNWIKSICRDADHVIVSTPALAKRYASHGRFTISPNYIPGHRFHRALNPEPVERPLLGWTGSIFTHPDDLEVAGSAVARALRTLDGEYGLGIVGTGEGVAERFGVAPEWTTGTWVPLDEYHAAVSNLRVGMVPLRDTAFNTAKSWLKALEYAACGVYPVASATEQNVALGKFISIDLVRKPRDWYTRLVYVMQHPALDEGIARNREAVKKHLLLENNLEGWVKAWNL